MSQPIYTMTTPSGKTAEILFDGNCTALRVNGEMFGGYTLARPLLDSSLPRTSKIKGKAEAWYISPKGAVPLTLQQHDEINAAIKAASAPAVPGLADLHDVLDAWSRYQDQMSRFVAGDGLGRRPQPPAMTVAEAKAAYPEAAAHLAAQREARAEHGSEGVARALRGED